MAHTTLNQYLHEVSGSMSTGDGQLLAELLSYRHPHIQNPRLQLENAEESCSQWLENPLDETVAAHLRLLWAAAQQNYVDAYGCQVLAVQSFLRVFQSQKEENWSLPVLLTLILDLRSFAKFADDQLTKKRVGKPGEKMEKAADVLMSCFRVCVSDTRSALETSKKWGTLPIVNHLFKIYFRINKVQLCKPLIRAINGSNIRDSFKLSHRVTYKYYVGRKEMFDGELKAAAEDLSFAFEHCHSRSRRNKRLVLIYLVPVKMLLGFLPSEEVLVKYKLQQFVKIVAAVREGNLLLLNDALGRHREFFIRMGIYLMLEKLKVIIYRNLFKKVYLLLNTHQLPIPAFLVALQAMQVADIDGDETQCILANLIDKGYIRGYISFQHQKLVVSKQNPFPMLSSFL